MLRSTGRQAAAFRVGWTLHRPARQNPLISELVSIAEAARIMRRSSSHVRRLIRTGELPSEGLMCGCCRAVPLEAAFDRAMHPPPLGRPRRPGAASAPPARPVPTSARSLTTQGVAAPSNASPDQTPFELPAHLSATVFITNPNGVQAPKSPGGPPILLAANR